MVTQTNSLVDPLATQTLPRSGIAELAVIIPTYNERENIQILVDRLIVALRGIFWEVIFVDDDSPDGTIDEIRRLASSNQSIRFIQRIGRRGLASACVEGILASNSQFVAIMDADLQHDESILRIMLGHLRTGKAQLVIGSRNMPGGSTGEFSEHRVLLSDLGATLSHFVCRRDLSDPMSGFFMMTRECFMSVVRELSSVGFKILVDILATLKPEAVVVEVPYEFRMRAHGQSKLDFNTSLQYLYLLVEKLSGGVVPVRFATFLLVGGTGLVLHLGVLSLLYLGIHMNFLVGQTVATLCAMTWNFFFNNVITFRDSRLRGRRLLRGLFFFYLVCSFGAFSNIVMAQDIVSHSWPWILAAITGVMLSSVWNYAMGSLFAWDRRPM